MSNKGEMMKKIINFITYLSSKRRDLYQDFLKEEELRELISPEKVSTFFQPILSLKEGSTIGFEVLNRPHKTMNFSTTEQFYEFISQSSDVFQVERFFRGLSLERYAEQINHSIFYKDQLVFLNINPQVLADPSFRSGITLELLSNHHLTPNQIVLEVTEKAAVINYHQFERIIDHYRQQGFRIAVDDAGTGYNSLQTLVYLKPEFIKIDKCLVQNISRHPEKQKLVELLCDYAFQCQTQVIAEGIETIEDLELLMQLGVHFGQGYVLGRPKPELLNGHLPLSVKPLLA
jgi:EAL domain-containing protein (putative c-di-GMP-specific phosphodiesterase class I)